MASTGTLPAMLPVMCRGLANCRSMWLDRIVSQLELVLLQRFRLTVFTDFDLVTYAMFLLHSNGYCVIKLLIYSSALVDFFFKLYVWIKQGTWSISHWLLFVYLFLWWEVSHSLASCRICLIVLSSQNEACCVLCATNYKYIRTHCLIPAIRCLLPRNFISKTLAACTVYSGTYNKVLTYFRVHNFAVLPSITQILNHFESFKCPDGWK